MFQLKLQEYYSRVYNYFTKRLIDFKNKACFKNKKILQIHPYLKKYLGQLGTVRKYLI